MNILDLVAGLAKVFDQWLAGSFRKPRGIGLRGKTHKHYGSHAQTPGEHRDPPIVRTKSNGVYNCSRLRKKSMSLSIQSCTTLIIQEKNLRWD
jgi:hypothetical protein